MTAAKFTSSGRAKRLFIDTPLKVGREIGLDRGQAHYVRNVVRLRDGDTVLVFNGRDGEWRARVGIERRAARLVVAEQVRPQTPRADLHYLFAPLKHARLDYLVQKATEMGAEWLRPVITERTVAARVNLERMRANAIEAAEQCGLLRVPDVAEPETLAAVIDNWPGERVLIFADEAAAGAGDFSALAPLRGRPLALLVGPEGGFSEAERDRLLALPATCPISLGPRILRADTAAVAALALVQATAGDWTVAAM